MKRRHALCVASMAATMTLLILHGEESSAEKAQFEASAHRLNDGRGAYLLAVGDSFSMLYTRRSKEGTGSDLYFRSSPEAREVRVNDLAGEVRDSGENGPILLRDNARGRMFAVWNAADSRHPLATRLRFSQLEESSTTWSSAITINDDEPTSTHIFQSAGLAPDGSIYVAWLDGREVPVGKPEDYPGGGLRTAFKLKPDSVAIYGARSEDGRMFGKNFRIAGDVCACCRATIGFISGSVLVAWRSVEDGDIRDISLARSSDNGKTWSTAQVVVRDGWKINACPHVGPVLSTVGDRLYLTWMTGGEKRRGVFLASSKDGGRTFGSPQMVSDGLRSATHPYLVSAGSMGVIVFQGVLDSQQAQDHTAAGHHSAPAGGSIYMRTVLKDGVLGPMVHLPRGSGSASYPFVALTQSGTVAVAWTEVHDEQTSGWWIRGDIQNKPTATSSVAQRSKR